MPTLYQADNVRVTVPWYDVSPQERDRDDSRGELFTTLEFKESRHRSLWVSVAVHGLLLSLLLVIPLLFTDTIKVRYHYNTVLLATPPIQRQALVEVTHYKTPPQKPEPQPEKRLAAFPLIVPPLIQPREVKLPEPPIAEKIAEVKLLQVMEPERPGPVLRTTARLNSADPTIAAPKIEVRMGGFGDPNGIKGEGRPGKIANIASLGSFDLPVGPDSGNGTGGTHGVKGTVASAGFGNGGGGGVLSRPIGAVHQSGFGDAAAAKPETSRKHIDAAPLPTPVEILFKPKPEYTDEARMLKLEGEVLVRVLFTATGERDGQPVDSSATVHIVFQLAY